MEKKKKESFVRKRGEKCGTCVGRSVRELREKEGPARDLRAVQSYFIEVASED